MESIPDIVLPGIVQGLFALAYLAAKNKRGRHDAIAATWIGLIVVNLAHRAPAIAQDMDFWFARMSGYPFVHGPCLYLYTRSLVLPQTRISTRDLIHAIPFAVTAVITAWPGMSITSVSPGLTQKLVWLIAGIAAAASLLGYSAAAVRLMGQHSRRLAEHFSNFTAARSLRWLRLFVWIFLAFLVFQNAQLAGLLPRSPAGERFLNLALYCYLILISFFCMRQDAVYAPEPAASEEADLPAKPRYERSALSEERRREIARELRIAMEEKRLYLSDDLGLADLASHLGVSSGQVSQVLTLEVGSSFYAFINEYRLQAVEEKLKDPAYAGHPVLRIALECGFSSKSSFHSVFKKMRGMSPGEMRAALK